jgi:transposase InsO family protein
VSLCTHSPPVPLTEREREVLRLVAQGLTTKAIGRELFLSPSTVNYHLISVLVVAALEMAVWNRRPGEGVIHHSDQGCQYTSLLFGERCQAVGIRCWMGSVGDCYDNALAESFFATLERELPARQLFQIQSEARTALFEYIEVFYNRQRRHSALGYLSPEAYARRWATQTAVVAQ